MYGTRIDKIADSMFRDVWSFRFNMHFFSQIWYTGNECFIHFLLQNTLSTVHAIEYTVFVSIFQLRSLFTNSSVCVNEVSSILYLMMCGELFNEFSKNKIKAYAKHMQIHNG